MLEPGYRERHLLSGIGLQLLLIGLLVFAYTQAIRQMNYKREMFLTLKEQVAQGAAQVTREGKPDLTRIRSGIFHRWEAYLAAPDTLSEWAKRIEDIARDRYGFGDLQVKVGSAPERSVRIPLFEESSLEVHLYPIELEGTATARSGAAFLNSMDTASFKLLCPLTSMQVKALEPEAPRPVRFRFKWLAATLPQPPQNLPQGEGWKMPAATTVAWGGREDPFASVFLKPGAVRVTEQVARQFRLTSIRLDPRSPRCVINGATFKLGVLVKGYKVVLIAPRGVLLQKADEELFLSL